MSKMKNQLSLIIIAVFMGAIFTPLIGAILIEDRTLSSTEKRKLKQLPDFPDKLSGIKSYISGFELYYNDQFGFRDFYIKNYAKVKKMLGDSEIASPSRNIGTKNIIKGKNGWHFLNRKSDGDPLSDYRNIDLYSEVRLLRSTLLFAARADWLKKQGIQYLFFFAPNKHTIYSEYLPDYIVKENEISSWDQLNDALRRNTDVQFVDLRKILQESKREAPKYWRDKKAEAALYYKMDSHWNSAGADIAQYAVAQKINEMKPGIIQPEKRSLQDFAMQDFAGDITLIMGRNDKEAYGPYLKSGTCTAETKKDYLQRNHETNCPKNSHTALIFHDSFFPPLKPYFTDYFGRTVYRWQRMNLAEVQKQIAVKKPDIVIEQRAERHLPFTPVSKNETYNDFWQKNWGKWKKTIYTLDKKAAADSKYRSYNAKFSYGKKHNTLNFKALTFDPMLYLPKINLKNDKLYLAKLNMKSSHDTELQFYYSIVGKKAAYPTEPNSVTVKVKKGTNDLYIPFFSLNMAGELRMDPGKKEGVYQIFEFKIKELTMVDLKQ